MKHGTMSMYVGGPCRCVECKRAARERMRVYSAANREKIRAQQVARRKRNHKAILAKEAEYRAIHRDKRHAYGVEYKRRNKEALLAKQRTSEGKAQRRMVSAARRARVRGQFIEDVDPRIVYQTHGGCCGICKEFVPVENFDVDHVIPIARGGMHGYVNCTPAHPICNKRKGAS